MFKKTPLTSNFRLKKAAAKKVVAAKQARADFAVKVLNTKVDAQSIAKAGRLVDRTRAAKAASFVERYRTTNVA